MYIRRGSLPGTASRCLESSSKLEAWPVEPSYIHSPTAKEPAETFPLIYKPIHLSRFTVTSRDPTFSKPKAPSSIRCRNVDIPCQRTTTTVHLSRNLVPLTRAMVTIIVWMSPIYLLTRFLITLCRASWCAISATAATSDGLCSETTREREFGMRWLLCLVRPHILA